MRWSHEHTNHRHRKPERRRWQNNNLCELGNRSGTSRKEIALLGVAVIITYSPQNGVILLVIAFLISPMGLPLAAIWLLGKVQDLKYAIQDRVYGWRYLTHNLGHWLRWCGYSTINILWKMVEKEFIHKFCRKTAKTSYKYWPKHF